MSAGIESRQGEGRKKPWTEDHPTSALLRISKILGYKPPKFHTIERVRGAPATRTVHLILHKSFQMVLYRVENCPS